MNKEEYITLLNYQQLSPTVRKALEQLINEHFDNTIGFEHFKLHNDSTLKTFKKDELIDYIHMIYHNWQNADWSYNNVMKYAKSLQKRIDELSRDLAEVESSLSRVSTQVNSNPPLKFEELHEGMWVWDNLIKEYKKIYEKEILCEEKWVGYYSDSVLFEENRFYRYEVKEVNE